MDKKKTKEYLNSIDELFESIPVNNEALKKRIRDLVLGPALEDVRKVVDESRPPVLMVIGRSGHGKSSLINALVGKEVAAVSDFKLQDPQVAPYLITFSKQHSTWKVMDTHGRLSQMGHWYDSADIAVLVSVQLLMISLIGALSGRTASKETAYEYLAAAGINLGAGFGFREIARQATKIIPVGGIAISGTIAATSTWAIGKSAEAYFFSNEVRLPKIFNRSAGEDGVE